MSYSLENGRTKTFINVPVNESDAVFDRTSTWIDAAVEINGAGDKEKGIKRITKYLGRRYRDDFRAALSDMRITVVEKMKAVQIAAMLKAANISSRPSRRQILRNMRHHFGMNMFEPEYKVQML